MKRQALLQDFRKSTQLFYLFAIFFALSFFISCDPGFSFDWNQCYIDESVINGSYNITDDCSMPGDNSAYTITITGSCETYSISNFLDPDSSALVSLTYIPWGSPQLSIPEQEYQGWTIRGNGSIENEILTLNLTLTKVNEDKTCTITGIKR
jgi:hypothetical protein